MTTPVRTSSADFNYLSCSNGIWGLNEGSTDPAYPEQNLPAQPVPLDLTPSDPQLYAAILKICDGTTNLDLSAGTLARTQGSLQIAQGHENSLDINNRVSGLTIFAEFGWGGGDGDQVITVKGGSHDNKIMGVIYSTGTNADYVQDAWSDQCSDLVSDMDLSGLTRADNQPVSIILGRFGSKVYHYPLSYHVLFWKSLGYKLYYVGKQAAVKLGLIKVVTT